MGSFLRTSKRASVTIVFLVISVLVISSGVIITNQIKKSNQDNVAGTGLVLLDNEQDISQNSDSSDDQVTFTFSKTDTKSSSKRSSGGGGGGGGSSSSNLQTYNEPEIPEEEEEPEGQVPENQTEINETRFTDGQIFEQNGTRYIMRDNAAYVLSTSSSDYYIEFDPPLPSSVCENERIDITVKGEAQVFCTLDDWIKLGFQGQVYISSILYLMEADSFPNPDDEVKSVASGGLTYDCYNVYFEETFKDIDLSDWIIPDPGAYGEFYAKIKGDGIADMSTSSYSVYGYVNDECDCLSGPCCDLSSRPYEYKPGSYGTQPTGYTDYYYCSPETSSPTSTNYCREVNYYCNGISAAASSKDSLIDTCGICEYCTAGDPTCNYYGTSTVCGIKDCDYLDTACRNYHDVGKYCNLGTCVNPPCTSYTDKPKHTSCGTNKECDGSGTCVTCTSHSYIGCWYNDVYYYDACGNREEKKDECGNSYCGDWYRDTCHGDDAYETKLCFNKGCTTTAPFGVHCYSNKYENERFVETCQYGCINGNCKSNPDIACFSNGGCGQNGFSENPYCYGDNIYDWFREYICHYPGTEQSFCTDEGHGSMIQDCLEDSYSDNYCYDDDVYQNFTDRGCLGGACFENTTMQFIYECGAEGCLDGECVYVECYNASECDPDGNLNNNYVGSPWCQSSDVWQNYVNYTCNYPGAGNSYCSDSTIPVLREECETDYCGSWGYDYCESDDIYHERTCHDAGCSEGVCFDNEYTEEEKVEECGTSEYTGDTYCFNDDIYRDYITRTCSYSRCTSSTSEKKIEDCEHGCTSARCIIEICSYGGCYYY